MRLTPLFRVPVARRRRPSRFRLWVEPLEARRVPAGFSTFLGGSDSEGGCSPAVDAAGNTYVIGHTWSTDFPTTFGSAHGQSDIYVVKLGPDGNLLWSGLYGGSAGDFTSGDPVVDGAGNLYLTGTTSSTDFPTTPGAFQELSVGTANASFVMKVDGATGAILYSTYLSANGGVYAAGLAVDGAGNAFVAGETTAPDLPTTPGAFQPTFGGGTSAPSDAFVLKLDPTGGSLVYATYLGGGQDDSGGGIAVDAAGNAYVTGTTWDSFPTTSGAYDTTANGPYESFVAKLDPAGGSLVYSTYLGGGGSDYGDCIAVDAAGNAYVGGWSSSTNFPVTVGAFDITHNGPAGGGDAYVAKLDPTGSSLVYATYIGGSKSEGVYDLAVDPTGSVIVTSHTESPDFPTTPDALSTTLNGPSDIYVSKLDPTGSTLLYSTYLGGSSDEYALGVATDRGGNAYVGGNTLSSDFPTSPGAWQGTYGGGSRDAFVTKLAIGTDVGPAATIEQAPGQADPTNGSPIMFNVVFDAPVTGFDGTDIDFTGSTVGGTLAAEVTGSGSTYTVTVTGMTGTGTVVASIPAGAADDEAGLPTQASTSTDNAVAFDDVVPSVTVARADGQAAVTNASPVVFLVSFSEPVVGFDASAVALSGTAAGATVTAVDPGPAPDSYLVTVDVPGTQAGTVIAAVPAGRVTDPAGNPNAGSTGDATVAFDNVPPTVTVTPALGTLVGGPAVAFAVVFSEPVVGFDASKVTWSAPAGAGIEVSGDGPAYTVTVSGMTVGGPVAVRVDAGAVADPAGNPNASSNDGSVAYVHSGTVQLSVAGYGVFEHGGATLTVTATRTDGSEGPLDVSFATADGTALAGTDYLATSGTLHWADGDTADKTFTVTILDDGVFEPDPAFTIGLSDIGLPGALGSPAAAAVTIYEEAVLAFTDPAPQVDEGAMGLQIPVHRTFGGHGDVSVTYTVTAGTATAGADYTAAATGTLSWADGDMADQFIILDVPHDGLSEGKETVFLTLSGATGNVVLGGPTTATLDIRPSDGETIQATAKTPRATFTDADGDRVTLTLGGKTGRLTFYRTDGGGGISEIDLEGTDPAKTTVTVAVKTVPGGDGRVRIGEINGTGLKSLKAKSADLVGAGINLAGFVGSVTIGDVLNGADLIFGGAPPAKPANAGTRITAGRLLGTGAGPTDVTFTDPHGRLTALTAVSVGDGTITAASVGSITITGRKATRTRPGVAGDFGSDLAVSGQGVNAGANAVGSVKVAGTVAGATLEVAGNVRSVRVGAFVDSSLVLGSNGTITPGLKLGSFTAAGLTDPAAPAFADSTITADRIGTVRLKSIGTADPDQAFGVTAGVSLGGLSVATPAFLFNPKGPSAQGLNLDQDDDLEFVVRVGP